MSVVLPSLPYEKSALAPHISAETLDYHYDKHHKTYVDKVNKLIEGTKYENKAVEEIIKTSEGSIFNNAAQVWNHTFYWHSMAPKAGGNPKDKIAKEIEASFGSFKTFKEEFSKAATEQFGSGWAWLLQDSKGKLKIKTTSNADCPLTTNDKPILTCDVWEHAYYIDYRNARAKYLDAWWNLVNWDFANNNL